MKFNSKTNENSVIGSRLNTSRTAGGVKIPNESSADNRLQTPRHNNKDKTKIKEKESKEYEIKNMPKLVVPQTI